MMSDRLPKTRGSGTYEATRPRPPAAHPAAARGATLLLVLLAGCTLTTGERWQSPLARRHPLVGSIWDVAGRRPLDEAALIDRLCDQTFVLLGERHDNPDHHRLQARILKRLIAAGRPPAVAFEMLSVDVEPALTRELAQPGVSSATLRAAVRWDDTGWPDWKIYQPIFEAALGAGVPIAPADLPASWLASMRHEGLGGLDAAAVSQLGLDEPLSPPQRQLLADQITEGHCGYALGTMVDRMVDMQYARDAHLAHELIKASLRSRVRTAVLIAGNEHVRRDVAVPVHLRRAVPGATVASIAFLEVLSDLNDPLTTLAEYFGTAPPFDYVWFTPRIDDTDPCAKFKESLHRLTDDTPALAPDAAERPDDPGNAPAAP